MKDFKIPISLRKQLLKYIFIYISIQFVKIFTFLTKFQNTVNEHDFRDFQDVFALLCQA